MAACGLRSNSESGPVSIDVRFADRQERNIYHHGKIHQGCQIPVQRMVAMITMLFFPGNFFP